jgi:hypothetical protein
MLNYLFGVLKGENLNSVNQNINIKGENAFLTHEVSVLFQC